MPPAAATNATTQIAEVHNPYFTNARAMISPRQRTFAIWLNTASASASVNSAVFAE